jgi:ROK family
VSPAQRSQGSSIALLERLVLACFANPAGLTRPELEELTGLSRTVVAGVVASLLERGELVQAHQSAAPGVRGRPPARYQRAALLPPVLLIRLGKDGSTSVSSVHGDGTSVAADECARWSETWPDWSQSVAGAAARLRAQARVPPRLAVLSAPFPVAEGEGAPRIYAVPPEVLKMTGKRMPLRSPWLGRDPRPALSDLLGCTALMVNDANLAALGEARFGAGRGRLAVVHVVVVNGVGAGFVFGGRLFTGAHGFSGELAHVQIRSDGYPCVCGNRGCLVTESPLRAGQGGQRMALPGHLAELGSLVGRALAPLVTVLDPDCVVVDARLGEAAELFIAGVTAEVAQRCPPPLAERLTVVQGELDDAEMFGALAAADAYAATLISESMPPALRPGAGEQALAVHFGVTNA